MEADVGILGNQIYLSEFRLKAERRQLRRCQTRLPFNHDRDSAAALRLIEPQAATLRSIKTAGINICASLLSAQVS